jgi:hypothetical protein
MSNFESFLVSQLILLPLIIGLIRIRKIHSSYYPFLALIILGEINEIASFLSIRYFQTNAVPFNIYSLLECLLILYQFYRWRFYAKPRAWYWAVPALFALAWIIEYLVFMQITRFSFVFRVSYAFVVAMLSINEINYLITHENRQLFKNARFLICMGFIIYFLYQILFEGAYLIIARDKNEVVSNQIIRLQVYVNALANLIFAFAMWFVPEKIVGFDRAMENYRKQYH